MNSFNIDVRFEGDKFYPSKLQSEIAVPMTILSEYGKIANRGRYAGKESPFGMAVFQFPVSENDVNVSLYECYSRLLTWKKALDECGVEEIVIDIGNFEDYPLDVKFSKELMNALNSLNATIEFHTVNKEKNLEHSKKVIKLLLTYFKKEDDYDSVYANLLKHNIIFDDVALSTFLYFYFSGNTSRSFEENINAIESLTNKVLQRA